MSLSLSYRDQAAHQQTAADSAVLDNVRDRCRRAASAWTTLAVRSERGDDTRAQAAISAFVDAANENPDRGSVEQDLHRGDHD